jgi:hypothetical protein
LDDTLFYSPKVENIDGVIKKLQRATMDLEVEGEVAGFLGVHIGCDVKGVEPLPIKYTPVDTRLLVKDADGYPIDGTFNYDSVIWMLQYLQNHTLQDITDGSTSREPKKSLTLRPNGQLKIDCMVDADFAGLWPHEDKLDPTCIKSCTEYFIKLANCLVIWGRCLQSGIPLATMEAKYNVLITTMH